MAKIYSIVGPQQAGKSTTARALAHLGCEHISFADPLYAMLATLMGVSMVEVRKLPKEEPMEELEGKTIRYALQSLGTEWGRNMIGNKLWLNTAKRRIEDCLGRGISVVTDDCRFPNEYDMLKDLGANFVRLERLHGLPEQSNAAHDSEAHWAGFEIDMTLPNPGTDEALWLESAGKRIRDYFALPSPAPA